MKLNTFRFIFTVNNYILLFVKHAALCGFYLKRVAHLAG